MDTCRWCELPLEASKRKGGAKREFCSEAHRAAYWKAARQYGDDAHREGRVDLRVYHEQKAA